MRRQTKKINKDRETCISFSSAEKCQHSGEEHLKRIAGFKSASIHFQLRSDNSFIQQLTHKIGKLFLPRFFIIRFDPQ